MSEIIQYKCKECGKSFFLLEEELTYSEQEEKYITCPYYGKHKKIIVCGKYGSLKEIKETMESGNVFVRKNGRMIRVR